MAEQLHTSPRSLCAMPSVGWSGVKHGATGLWSSENVFSGVMNHGSLSGSLMINLSFVDPCFLFSISYTKTLFSVHFARVIVCYLVLTRLGCVPFLSLGFSHGFFLLLLGIFPASVGLGDFGGAHF